MLLSRIISHNPKGTKNFLDPIESEEEKSNNIIKGHNPLRGSKEVKRKGTEDLIEKIQEKIVFGTSIGRVSKIMNL